MKTIVTLLVILPYCSSAQGLFITGDQSATTIQAAYATDIEASFATNQPSVSTQGIEIGHSMGGTFDVGLRLGRDRLDSYYNTIFYGLSTSLYLLKPDSLDGAIVSLDGAYTRLNMKVENFFYN